MSRNLTKALALGAALGFAGAAYGQDTLNAFNNPVDGTEELVSLEGIVSVDYTGSGDDDTVTTSIQFFVIPGDGATGPTLIGTPIEIDDGTGGDNVIDTDGDSTFGDAFLDSDGAAGMMNFPDLRINLATATTNVPAINTTLATAQTAAGASGAIGIQFIFSTASDPDVTTMNPTTFDGESFNAGATSPRLLDDDLTISNAFFDSDNNQLILEFPVSIAVTGPNGTDVTAVNQTDLEVDDANDFMGAANPTALTGNPVIGGSDNQTLTFTFDDSVMTPDIPEIMEFVRIVGTDVEDFTGRKANADTDGAQIVELVEFAVNSASWLQKVAPNSANVADALAIEFTLPVDPANLPDQNFLRMVFENEGTDNLGDEDLVQPGGFIISNIAVDTDLDATGATIVVDVESPNNNLGVAANGRNNDGDTANDIGPFDSDSNPDENQKAFQLVTQVDTGTQPMSTLGTAYLGGTMGEEEVTAIDDQINPTFIAVSFHDLDGDGVLDAIAAIADEALADSTSNGGVTIQALDGAMVQPFADIDMMTGALPDPVALDLGGMDEEITSFDTAVGSVDPDLSSDGPSVLETNNAVIFSNLDLSGIGDDLPGTGDADVFDFAYDMTMGSFEDTVGNAVNTLAATNADEDRAAPVFVTAFHQDSENIPQANLTDSNIQCFAEADDGVLSSNDVGQNRNDRGIFAFSENVTAPGTPGNITVDGTLVSAGGGPTTFLGDTQIASVGNNVITVIDDAFNGAAGLMANIPSTVGLSDTTGNDVSVADATLNDATDPYLPLQMDVNGGVGHAAFLVDADDDGFADQILLFMNGPVDSVPAGAEDDFTFAGFAFTPDSVEQDASNPNILVLDVSSNDGNISMTTAQSITYNGSSADTLITGDAKDSTFNAEDPATPDVQTESPWVMAINGTIMINGSPAPVGTQVCGMIAVPTVRSVTAEKDGLTFRYDRSDVTQGENPASGVTGNVIQRSLEDFTNFFLGLEERMYLLCASDNVDLYSNTKFGLDKDGSDASTFTTSIGLSVNTSRLDRVSFSGQSGNNRVRNGSLQLAYDVLRSGNGTLDDLIQDGYCLDGDPIVSKAVVTNTDGSYSLYVSLPNLEASDADDGMANDPNIFATQSLPVIILVETPGGEVFPASSLVNNINGGGPILFSAEALSQNSDGSASGALQFNIDTANVGFQSVFTGYNMLGFDRNSGFAESSQAMPVLPDGVNEDNVVIGDPLLPSAGPEDQFVWWTDTDGDGVFDGNEVGNIVVDNDAITSFPFILSSRGVQFGTRGITNFVGGYSLGFGNFTGSTLGVAQFGTPLNQAALFTNNTFPNNNTTRGWASVTVTMDYDNIADFFTANPNIDFAINFDRTSNTEVDVSSASPAGGPNSANDLTSVEAGDTLIVHYAN